MIDHKELKKIEYLANKYDETNMPSYISYPTTGFWKKNITIEDFISSSKNADSPFLYFHFPYCKKACYYCVCYKKVTTDMTELDSYNNYIIREYNKKLDLMGIDKLSGVSQIHWGGGSPTYLTMKQIEHVFKEIEKRADIDKSNSSSISIEAYPDVESITPEKLKLLKDLGFNEISFGIQDFDKKTQETINREYDTKIFRALTDQARELGFRIHVDLCYGLPFQGQNEYEKTIKEVLAINPDRIATYPYSHYPFLFPMQKYIPGSSIPNSFIKVLMSKLADELFADNNYAKIGFDHFTSKNNVMYDYLVNNRVERDFMGYSINKRQQLLGFGNSAISFLGDTFFHNIAEMNPYKASIDNGHIGLDYNISHSLTEDDTIRRRIIMKHILTYNEINKQEIENDFGISFNEYFSKELGKLSEFEKDGLIENTDSKISLTKYGVYFSRHIAYTFDDYYKN